MKRKLYMYFRYIFILMMTATGLVPLCSNAQNAAARYEVDAKRMGVSPVDKDALPRGREFVRLDSTYYVGWLYQGVYLHDRSADEPGYRKALPFLRRAFYLLDKDYGNVLKIIYNDPNYYMQNNVKYSDYLLLSQKLREAYEYLEVPDSAMWVVKQVERKNFRRDFWGVAGAKSWIIHRNRFYTKARYDFLGNSVAENEQLALQACYDGFNRIKRNAGQNDLWFGPQHALMDRQFINHYLAIIHCYMKNYDSSEYYYNQMASNGAVSWNNYGGMKNETGEFATAIKYFSEDRYKYNGLKFLQEPFYYLPLLSVYGAKPKESIATAQEAVLASNSSPGFGWYNIALARGYLYDAQLDSADITLTRAKEFKEIHIGTTLTQPQYEFSIGLLRLVWYDKKIEQVKFFHDNWWYNPKAIYELGRLKIQKYTHEYLLATQLAMNPERARIIYDLFCSESTVTWDEAFPLLKDFSPNYFIRQMDEQAKTDPREKIKRYFELFSARLMQADGKEKDAQKKFVYLLDNTLLDTTHEKLFLARMYEGLSKGYAGAGDKEKSNFYVNMLLDHFPQLLPFTNIKTNFKLNITGGDADEVTKDVVNELKACNINWVETADSNTPTANIVITKKGIKYEAVINVVSGSNKKIVSNARLLFKTAAGAGQEIALRLFGKGGALEIEEPVKPVEPLATAKKKA